MTNPADPIKPADPIDLAKDALRRWAEVKSVREQLEDAIDALEERREMLITQLGTVDQHLLTLNACLRGEAPNVAVEGVEPAGKEPPPKALTNSRHAWAKDPCGVCYEHIYNNPGTTIAAINEYFKVGAPWVRVVAYELKRRGFLTSGPGGTWTVTSKQLLAPIPPPDAGLAASMHTFLARSAAPVTTSDVAQYIYRARSAKNVNAARGLLSYWCTQKWVRKGEKRLSSNHQMVVTWAFA